MEQEYSSRNRLYQDIYDFSGPLWEKYYKETRRNVKFPRGYKDVSLFDDLIEVEF